MVGGWFIKKDEESLEEKKNVISTDNISIKKILDWILEVVIFFSVVNRFHKIKRCFIYKIVYL